MSAPPALAAVAFPSRPRRAGFTLIEVLVVVAIMALLIAILLPSLGRARALARNGVCNHNLHQFGVAMNVFAGEHKGFVPRGISRHGFADASGPINWVRMVARLFGDKNAYAINFNRVPVEKYEAFSCPERFRDSNARFLDYVVNSTDSRGPINASTCQPDPAGGSWYEVEGVTKIDQWKFPGETVYITEAIEESWNIDDPNNSFSTMKGIRENIGTIRAQAPPTSTGLDWFDVAGGRNFPTYREYLSSARRPRAALKMHLGRGSNAVFADAHVAML
ncbi:MAG: type II secretion system protein, partial [Phycisphaerae bacterium]